MSKKVSVCFLKRMSPYQPGEVAGFEAEEADRLIKAKIAEPYKVKGKAVPDTGKEAAGTPPVAATPVQVETSDQQGAADGAAPKSGS